MNRLKSTAFLIFSIFLFSCNSDNTITDPGGGNTALNLSDSIQGWPQDTLIAQVIATGTGAAVLGTDTVHADGIFNIQVTTPPSAIMRPITELTNDTGITISNTSALYASFGSLTVFDLAANVVGRVEKKNFDTTIFVGAFQVSFIFLDQACNITGTTMSVSGTDTMRIEANLLLSAGWNVIYTQLVEQRPGFMRIIAGRGEPAGATWRFSIISTDNRFGRIF